MPPIRPSCATEPDADQSVPSHLPRIVFSIVSAPVSARKTRVPFILIGAPEMRALAIQPSECRRQCSAPSNWLVLTSLSLSPLPSLPFRKATEPPKLPTPLLHSAPRQMPHHHKTRKT